MSERTTITKKLKEDIETNFSIANGYNTDLREVVLGIVSFDQFSQRPSLGYWMWSDEKDTENYDETRLRWLNFYIYAYTDDEDTTDYENIYNLADDIEDFLMSDDWTYTTSTILGDVVIVIGGIEKGRAMAEVNIKVAYYQGCD